jgi:hypothetical protein
VQLRIRIGALFQSTDFNHVLGSFIEQPQEFSVDVIDLLAICGNVFLVSHRRSGV